MLLLLTDPLNMQPLVTEKHVDINLRLGLKSAPAITKRLSLDITVLSGLLLVKTKLITNRSQIQTRPGRQRTIHGFDIPTIWSLLQTQWRIFKSLEFKQSRSLFLLSIDEAVNGDV